MPLSRLPARIVCDTSVTTLPASLRPSQTAVYVPIGDSVIASVRTNVPAWLAILASRDKPVTAVAVIVSVWPSRGEKELADRVIELTLLIWKLPVTGDWLLAAS